ncbi:hypothetical protein [Mycobacterium stomatepiae]|uniref:hypothetical protein n=1 Tax=Mycobacterium stomatepiae TaxID=470076 RepID=UPI0021F34CFD|nr:hypothetical protein [Mycobacterium stomatepiae]MCV7167151.1 hypothetical protein [Mycobacterium stomatepiae]
MTTCRLGAREPRGQCVEHSSNIRNAILGCDKTLGWIDVALRLASKVPFDFCCDKVLAEFGEFATQDLGELLGLSTIGGCDFVARASA